MATKVLILGATGSLGSVVVEYLLDHTDCDLTLYARSITKDAIAEIGRESVITADVTDESELQAAVQGQNVVFAALSGNLPEMADSIVRAMDKEGVRRLIFITSIGIENEIPAPWSDENLASNPMLKPYREAADIIEASDLNYTIIRPAWYTNKNTTDYTVTLKGQKITGHEVSRKSIADLVMKLIEDPSLYNHESIGINN